MSAIKIIQGLSDAEYHGDLSTLSSSGARQLLTSPAKFHYDREHPRPYNPNFEIGHAAHTLVLGKGSEIVVIDPQGKSKSTNAWKVGAEKALAERKTPLTPDEWRQVRDMHLAITEHPVAGPLFARKDGIAEQSLYWTDEDTGVACKARPDWHVPGIIVDYKTTVDASENGFAKSIASYGYHLQASWYLEGAAACGFGVDLKFVFVVQEKAAPYLVQVFQLGSDELLIGHAMGAKARQIFAECTEKDEWPGYPNEITFARLPRWAKKTMSEEYLGYDF